MAQKRKLERLVGRAESQLIRQGTASEHRGVVLTTDDGERLLLQRIGGNPFADGETQKLAGKPLAVEGFRLDDIFRYTRAEVAEEDPSETAAGSSSES